jgi:hypothetical protein
MDSDAYHCGTCRHGFLSNNCTQCETEYVKGKIMNDIEFVPGLIVKQRASNAPDYVICKLSIKPNELAEWLQSKSGEWVNVEVKVSKSGKAYAAVDSWKPEAQNQRHAPSSPQTRPQAAPQRAAPTRQQAPARAPAPAPRSAPAPGGFDDLDDDIPF